MQAKDALAAFVEGRDSAVSAANERASEYMRQYTAVLQVCGSVACSCTPCREHTLL